MQFALLHEGVRLGQTAPAACNCWRGDRI